MKFVVEMNCGVGVEKEQKELLKQIIEVGVLNIEKQFSKKIMPNIEKYDFSIEDNLFDKIKNDKELYYAYQANVAMAFKDEYYNYKNKKGKAVNNDDIHIISNNAAKNFLDLLLK